MLEHTCSLLFAWIVLVFQHVRRDIRPDGGKPSGAEHWQALTDTLPGSAVLTRLGGDEFLLLPDTAAADAAALLERVRTRLTAAASLYISSVSYRITELSVSEEPPVNEALRRADAQMYRLKEKHRPAKP